MIYRVEIRKDGSIVSCDVVETALKNGGLVCYVDAENKSLACEKAKACFEQFRKWSRERTAVLQKAKLCAKCAAPTGGKLLCLKHREEKYAAAAERNKLKTELSPEAFKAAMAARKEKQQQKSKKILGRNGGRSSSVRSSELWESNARCPVNSLATIACLRRCLEAYDRDPEKFRTWLLAKLGLSESTAAE